MSHACFTRGDNTKAGELEAMFRGKNATFGWINQLFIDVYPEK